MSDEILNQKIRVIIDEAIKILSAHNNHNVNNDNIDKNHNYDKNNSNNNNKPSGKSNTDGSISKDEISKEIAKVTSLVIPDQVEPFEESSSPLVQYAKSYTLHGNKETEPLLQLIREVADHLPWKYNYEERGDLGSYMGWAELIGPEAPFRTDEWCLGFTLITPGTLYPEHRHPAIELYKVLAGTADWTLEGVTSSRKAGEVILHPSNKIHKMETHDETLLALYTWTGSDVVTLSSYT